MIFVRWLLRTCCVALLTTAVALADPSVAVSPEQYYRDVAKRQDSGGPTLRTFLELRHLMATETYEVPSEEVLSQRVAEEIEVMLVALDVDLQVTRGLARDLRYPSALATRLDGRVPAHALWTAACHGVMQATDRFSMYFTPEEYRGLQCGGYFGPPMRPAYR